MTFYNTNDGHWLYKVFYWSTDTVPPSIAISSPVATGQTYNTSTATVNVSGTASDNVGVGIVIWDNNRGGGGTASGTTNWSATGIALQSGANIITVHAYDAAGNTQTASITVNYTATVVDTIAPTVSAFSVTPSSLTVGSAFTISYTVSDTGGSGLWQMQLFRTTDSNGVPVEPWTKITVNSLSGNGPVSGSFIDAPPSVGTYWYGGHGVDNAGNIGYEPMGYKVKVIPPPTDTVTIVSGPSGTPNPVASGGTATLSVTATDSLNHTLTYSWAALCSGLPANGTFSNASLQNPTWTAPTNTTGSAKSCTLTVTASDGSFGHSATKSVTETVNASTADTVTIVSGPSGTPNPVASGGTATLSVTATDSLNHTLSYNWSALCSGLPSNGTFSSASLQNPTWIAPTNTTGAAKTCTLTVTANDGFGHSAAKNFPEMVSATTTASPTGSWTTPPPASLTVGQQFTIAWKTTGEPTHVNVHWNPSDPLAQGCCLGSADTTDSSTVSPTRSPAGLKAPTKNADGTPITLPTTIKYVVHVSNSAGSGNSEIVSVTVNPSPKVATPTFSPPPGTFTKPVKVRITTATMGATIRYTTDGSAPTATSPRYSRPLALSQTTVLKARAFKSGMADSDVAEGTYTFVIPQKIVLLLHGINSNPETWNSLAQKYFQGACETIYAGVVLATPRPNPKGTLCYRVKFGEYDQSGPEGLDEAKKRAGQETRGDFSTFEQLGEEVAEAVKSLRNAYQNVTILLVGHSRGGLAARAFLQGSQHAEEKASVVGLITTGTPHLGTRLGRIYAYLESHSRETDKETWLVVDLLQDHDFDVRKPGVAYLSDQSDEIKKLNQLPSITGNIQYGQISYNAFDLGFLARASGWLEEWACVGDVYSIFDDWGFDCGDLVSEQAWKAMLDEKSPNAYKGDGTVPSDSQLGAAPSHVKQLKKNAPEILHTEEPDKVADVLLMFKRLGLKDWLQ